MHKINKILLAFVVFAGMALSGFADTNFTQAVIDAGGDVAASIWTVAVGVIGVFVALYTIRLVLRGVKSVR